MRQHEIRQKEMNVSKESIWHFTCDHCMGFWSVATMDEWQPKDLYCTHCGKQNTNEWCSCGHKVIECDCKAGCKCGCRKQFLNA